MKISPIVLRLREKCPGFEKRVGGTADIPTAEEATNLPLPCAIVLAPKDSAEPVAMQTRYVQTVNASFDVVIYTSTRRDERGRDAYDLADALKSEVIFALAGWEPDDCNDWVTFDGAEVSALNPAYLAYRLSFSCAYQINDGVTAHGDLIEHLPRFLRLENKVVGTEGDPSGQTPIATQFFDFTE